MRRSTRSSSGLRKIFGKSEFYLLLVIVVVSLFFTIMKPSFLTFTNIYGMVESNSFLAIMAAGVLVVLISGGIDISFTAIATVAQYVMATIVIHWGGNMFLAFAIGGVVGIALGLINALLIYFLKTPPIIVTIATMNLFYGLLIFISGGTDLRLPNVVHGEESRQIRRQPGNYYTDSSSCSFLHSYVADT